MIYLDNAATTLIKPAGVRRAVMYAMERMSSPGRGGYAAARMAEETLFRCRELAARYFDAASADQVVFTFNATHGLNIAIKSLVPSGGTALISAWEHNAVTRPLYALHANIVIADAPLFDEVATLAAFADRLAVRPDAVICTHVSNVFGFRLPIEKIALLCQKAGIPLIVDASQSAGILPISMQKLGAEFIAMPGHKGLYGPQGSGILLCAGKTVPLMEGGTGSVSVEQSMPDFLPDRLEAGTCNVPGIAGLTEGLRFVSEERGRIAPHENGLIRRAAEGLRRIPNIHVYFREGQAGVLSFWMDGRNSEEVAQMLAAQAIAVRAGLHCAPLAHRSAGTLPDGTVRVSVSAFNRLSDVDTLLAAVRHIAQKRRGNS